MSRMDDHRTTTTQEREANNNIEVTPPATPPPTPGMVDISCDAQNNNAMIHLEEKEESKRQNGVVLLQPLDPPLSCGEQFRDSLLEVLEGRFFTGLNALVLFLVVGDGAAFFFLLMGWQSLCRPRTDCPQRNRGYNITVQILTGLFSYMAIVASPWRCTNFFHLTGWSCPFRSFTPGHDWYGQPTNRIWFHIPRTSRLGITICFVLSGVTQAANQVSRIIYHTYDLQNVPPGNLWTNLFFASSFGFAGMGAIWLLREESRLRQTIVNHPFGPGPIALVQQYWAKVKTRRICSRKRS